MKLTQQLRELGFNVIESYPGAAQDILGITRKKVSTTDLKQGLIDFGLAGTFKDSEVTHDELDAITSALVGYFYLTGWYEALGNEEEGYLIVPKSSKLELIPRADGVKIWE
jgi:predicted nuclease with RNAse H fold